MTRRRKRRPYTDIYDVWGKSPKELDLMVAYRKKNRRSSELKGLGRDIRGMSKDILDIGVSLAMLQTMSQLARNLRSS